MSIPRFYQVFEGGKEVDEREGDPSSILELHRKLEGPGEWGMKTE